MLLACAKSCLIDISLAGNIMDIADSKDDGLFDGVSANCDFRVTAAVEQKECQQ